MFFDATLLRYLSRAELDVKRPAVPVSFVGFADKLSSLQALKRSNSPGAEDVSDDICPPSPTSCHSARFSASSNCHESARSGEGSFGHAGEENDVKSEVIAAVARQVPIQIYPSDMPVRDIVLQKTLEAGAEDPFYICDLSIVARKYDEWKANLPRVEPFFAMKANPDPAIMHTLFTMGAGFDCASKAEIQAALALGCAQNKIIYANPCKAKSMLQYADAQGVRMMTFDNGPELLKIKENSPNAHVVLRILTDDSKSICAFGTKFGCSYLEAIRLIAQCKELNLNLVGVSFHVGSGCLSVDAFVNALLRARKVFDAAEAVGFTPSLLDIGGGWPGEDVGIPSFPEIAAALRPVLDELFPSNIRVIAEPGRYFTAQCKTLAANVIARRDTVIQESRTLGFDDLKSRDADVMEAVARLNAEAEASVASLGQQATEFKYYINDGVYGSFNCIIFDHAIINPIPLRAVADDEPKYVSDIFGPTCDSMDLVCKRIEFPKLEVGDWMYFEATGSYTKAAASTFNGFVVPTVHYIFRSS